MSVNALIYIVIGLLKEDPLSTGMLNVYFQKRIKSFFFVEWTPTE